MDSKITFILLFLMTFISFTVKIVTDLLDLVRDGAIYHFYHSGLHVLRSVRISSTGQPQMPSYGVQVDFMFNLDLLLFWYL